MYKYSRNLTIKRFSHDCEEWPKALFSMEFSKAKVVCLMLWCEFIMKVEPHLVQVLQTLKAAVIFLASCSSHLSAVRA